MLRAPPPRGKANARFRLIILYRSCATIPRIAQDTHTHPTHGERRSYVLRTIALRYMNPSLADCNNRTNSLRGYYSIPLIKKKGCDVIILNHSLFFCLLAVFTKHVSVTQTPSPFHLPNTLCVSVVWYCLVLYIVIESHVSRILGVRTTGGWTREVDDPARRKRKRSSGGVRRSRGPRKEIGGWLGGGGAHNGTFVPSWPIEAARTQQSVRRRAPSPPRHHSNLERGLGHSEDRMRAPSLCRSLVPQRLEPCGIVR
ncbi:hypothetical protein BJV78DRAFT_936592 [Lactifluus subvellereus]|nr:hypothetical protein BJV78DRAFT_936592 [Lactifluus subvellereus]